MRLDELTRKFITDTVRLVMKTIFFISLFLFSFQSFSQDKADKEIPVTGKYVISKDGKKQLFIYGQPAQEIFNKALKAGVTPQMTSQTLNTLKFEKWTCFEKQINAWQKLDEPGVLDSKVRCHYTVSP